MHVKGIRAGGWRRGDGLAVEKLVERGRACGAARGKKNHTQIRIRIYTRMLNIRAASVCISYTNIVNINKNKRSGVGRGFFIFILVRFREGRIPAPR